MRDYLLQSSVCLHVNYADLPFTADRERLYFEDRVKILFFRHGTVWQQN